MEAYRRVQFGGWLVVSFFLFDTESHDVAQVSFESMASCLGHQALHAWQNEVYSYHIE